MLSFVCAQLLYALQLWQRHTLRDTRAAWLAEDHQRRTLERHVSTVSSSPAALQPNCFALFLFEVPASFCAFMPAGCCCCCSALHPCLPLCCLVVPRYGGCIVIVLMWLLAQFLEWLVWMHRWRQICRFREQQSLALQRYSALGLDLLAVHSDSNRAPFARLLVGRRILRAWRDLLQQLHEERALEARVRKVCLPSAPLREPLSVLGPLTVECTVAGLRPSVGARAGVHHGVPALTYAISNGFAVHR